MKKIALNTLAIVAGIAFAMLAFGSCSDTGSSAVSVTRVSLSSTILNLIAGGSTGSLTATVSPSDATNAAVAWSSSDSAVAAVNSSGVVTPVAAGSAVITVTTSDGGKTATCTVNVQGPTDIVIVIPGSIGVSFSLPSSTIVHGSSINVTAVASTAPDAVSWYLDGLAVPGQASLSFSGGASLGYGPHDLMVLVSKGGAYASDTRYFTVQ